MENIRQGAIRSVIMLAAIIIAVTAFCVSAQKIAVKTNIVSDATLNPNIGIETRIAPKWSLDVSGQFNLWTLSQGRKYKHWLVQPEARYWFCEATAGHFLGAHLMGGQFNMANWKHGINFLGTDSRKLRDHRYQGWFAGVGIAYGYSWLLSEHWNLEAELGIGWTYNRYDVYPCTKCGRKLASNAVHNYVGPTKIAVSLVYVF